MKEDTIDGELSYIPSKYSKALNLYTKTHMKSIVPFLNSISKSCDYSAQYPVCKVLKAVSKIFLLNEIEVIFLAYLIRQTKWDIKEKIIYSNAQHVQDIVCYSIESLNYKRIILYLMVSAYTVKYYLNENNNDALEEAIKRCPNFKKIFESWAKKHSTITTKINPRTLNSVYKLLYMSIRKEKPDFNSMVDAILQISPAYNPERDKTNKEQKKKNNHPKQQPPPPIVPLEQQRQIILKEEKPQKSPPILNQPGLSSSAIMGMVQQPSHQNPRRKDSASGLNPFLSSKGMSQDYQGMLESSLVRGLKSDIDIRDDGDCGQLVLGLEEGQSQENLYFDQEGTTKLLPSNASTVNLGEAMQIAEKYLSPESKISKFPPQ